MFPIDEKLLDKVHSATRTTTDSSGAVSLNTEVFTLAALTQPAPTEPAGGRKTIGPVVVTPPGTAAPIDESLACSVEFICHATSTACAVEASAGMTITSLTRKEETNAVQVLFVTVHIVPSVPAILLTVMSADD